VPWLMLKHGKIMRDRREIHLQGVRIIAAAPGTLNVGRRLMRRPPCCEANP
jgi:hypothetical protein